MTAPSIVRRDPDGDPENDVDGVDGGLGPDVDDDPEIVRSAPLSGAIRPGGPFRSMTGIEFLGFLVAVVGSLFVFGLLNWPKPSGWSDIVEPRLFLDTTPSGGDMGAHVWGPAYLRDNLLPQGRLSGWTPDWYAGFPAYQFYMVVPSLAIIAVNTGLPWFIGIPVAAAVLYGAYRLGRLRPGLKGWIMAAGAVAAVLLVGFPYGVAFKLVSVSGLVFFPLSAWAMGRLARSPEPIPALLSLGALIFLFDTNFTIYGGNIASTLAGEFAFSISLCLSLLAIGMTIRGMDDRKWRAPAAVVIGLVALCHIIPVFFMVPALILLVLLHRSVPVAWAVAATLAFAVVPIAFADGTGLGVRALAVIAVAVVLLSAMVAEPAVMSRSIWLIVSGLTGVLLTAFWLVPFYLREPFFNDMGWERLNAVGEPLLTVPMKVALPVAAIGLLTAYANRERIGITFAATGTLFAAAVANLGEGPLWNARLLPFYYLSVYLLAAVGIGLMVRFIGAAMAGSLDRPDMRVLVAAPVAALFATLVAIAMPLRILPSGAVSADGGGDYEWLVFSNRAGSFIPGWAEWNYSGYERKSSYAEYANVVSVMDDLGRDGGCGRAMWEYDKELDRYGTPMALMLLPHWTDGCIGSMEGLYFESSATTPFHFLNQSMLSEAPSRAQRDLPYQGFDIDRGIAQLQVMGVRYYLAQSDTAIAAAREHADLIEVGEAQPFVIFQVYGSELVEGLSVEPVVASGRTAEQVLIDLDDATETEADVSRFDVGWVSQAVEFYNDPDAYAALPAEDGPAGWERQESLMTGDGVEIAPTQVSNIRVATNRISFEVDEVGTPVLVKASFFPNWNVEGAQGPWRAGPNLMVVVPTDESVVLSYGRTPIDLAGIGLSLVGIAAVVGLAVFDRRRPSLAERLRQAEAEGTPVRTVVDHDEDGLEAAPTPGDGADLTPDPSGGSDRSWDEFARSADERTVDVRRDFAEGVAGLGLDDTAVGLGGGAPEPELALDHELAPEPELAPDHDAPDAGRETKRAPGGGAGQGDAPTEA